MHQGQSNTSFSAVAMGGSAHKDSQGTHMASRVAVYVAIRERDIATFDVGAATPTLLYTPHGALDASSKSHGGAPGVK